MTSRGSANRQSLFALHRWQRFQSNFQRCLLSSSQQRKKQAEELIILQPEKIWRQTRLSREGSRSAVNHLLSFLKEQGSFLAYLWAELSFSVLGLILHQKKQSFLTFTDTHLNVICISFQYHPDIPSQHPALCCPARRTTLQRLVFMISDYKEIRKERRKHQENELPGSKKVFQ